MLPPFTLQLQCSAFDHLFILAEGQEFYLLDLLLIGVTYSYLSQLVGAAIKEPLNNNKGVLRN